MALQYIRINKDGTKYYYSDKKMTVYHREDGPAIEYTDGSKSWYRDGVRHREDGPACEWCDIGNSWFIDGKELSEAEFKSRKTPHNGKKVVVDGVEYTLTVK